MKTCLQTDNTTTDLTKITEEYGLQAAAGRVKDGKQSWVKDNIGNYTSKRKYKKDIYKKIV